MAFYELIINESKEPCDNQKIFDSVYSLKSKLTITATTTTTHRISNINLTKGLIQDYFQASQNSGRSPGSYMMDLENCLRRSKIEAPYYDFKQGLYNLSNDHRCFDEKCFEKICQNISAIANLGKGKKGFILLGVTDNEQDTKRVECLDEINAPRFDSFGIVGLEREANIHNTSLDNYILFISRKIRNSQLPEWLKTQINTNLIPINYQDYTVLMIKIEAGNEPAWYKNKLYIRDGHEKQAQEKSGEQISAVYSLFK